MSKVECSVLNASALPEVILVHSEVFKSTPLLASQLINGAFVLEAVQAHQKSEKFTNFLSIVFVYKFSILHC
jgi:hypothetical protein